MSKKRANKGVAYHQKNSYAKGTVMEIKNTERTSFMVGEPVRVIENRIMRLEPDSENYSLVTIVESLEGVRQAVTNAQIKQVK
jgi:hypothetical protein